MNNKIRLIHHGGAMKERKPELMIKMMKYLDPEKYDLTFMLVKNNKMYYDYLVQMSNKFENIHFADPVDFGKIPNTINKYDIGVYLLKPDNFNGKHALPNKLFEFVQARLAIAIGPSIEMVKIVDRYALGVHSAKFTPKSMADSIAAMRPEKIMEYKRNADKFARELSAEKNVLKIKAIVSGLMGV